MNVGILPSVNFTEQKRAVKPEISVCSRIVRLMNKQTKSQRKAITPTKRRENDDNNAVAIVKIVPQLGCVSQDSDALVSQRGKQFRGNPMQKSLGINSKSTVHSVYATSSKYLSGKSKDHRWKKTKVVPRQRSPYAMKFEERSHEETERQERCAQSKAWGLAKKIFKLKENDRATFFSLTMKWVVPSASSRESCEREFVVDSGASMHMLSKRDLNSAELATMRTSKSPTTVMTANGEVQTREEATVYVKQVDLFVKVMLL